MAARLPEGLRLLPEALDRDRQQTLLAQVLACLAVAPPFQPAMPRTGRPLSVQMSNAGSLGWVSDRLAGYRYQPHHPQTGAPWPAIPQSLLALWQQHCRWPDPPEACLINLYTADARMGLHVDADEEALAAPVLSVSLGSTALFRVGGPQRQDPTVSLPLRSGDVLVLGGPARACHHGIDRIRPGTSQLVSRLLPGVERINLTLRRVTTPAS